MVGRVHTAFTLGVRWLGMLAAEGCLKDGVAPPSACKLLHSKCLYGFLKDEACFCKFPVYVRLWVCFSLVLAH